MDNCCFFNIEMITVFIIILCIHVLKLFPCFHWVCLCCPQLARVATLVEDQEVSIHVLEALVVLWRYLSEPSFQPTYLRQ